MKDGRYSIEWTVDLGDEEPDVCLHYDYNEGSAEYIPPYNRPELYDPGSAGEVCIVRVERLDNGDEIVLNTEQQQQAEEWIEEHHAERNSSDDDYGDYLYEQARERSWEDD